MDASDLAAQIRAELHEPAPQGFHFQEHVLRQDASLERLSAQLKSHPDAREVGRAVAQAIEAERDGWTLLKLLGLCERLESPEAAEALLQVAGRPSEGDDRSRFLAGRACEVILKLPLDQRARARANAACREPLEELQAFRLGAARARHAHRPRRIEWALLVVMMALGVAGFVFAWLALGR